MSGRWAGHVAKTAEERNRARELNNEKRQAEEIAKNALKAGSPSMWAAIVDLRQARVGKKISLEGNRITIPEIKAAFLAKSGDEDSTV